MQDAFSLNERDDLAAQSGLMALVLSLHPTTLTAAELEPQMSADADAFEQALWELTGAGLLRREGESVIPTYAALTFDRLPL
jgi:hypothetical protein